MKGKNKQQKTELEKVFSQVVNILNEIRAKPKNTRAFTTFCDEVFADYSTLIMHSEIRFLSRGKVLERFLSLKNEVHNFLTQEKDDRANFFNDEFWLAKVSYLSSIFTKLNELNLAMQGKGGDIFDYISKIKAIKIKLKIWKNNVERGNFSNFISLDKFLMNNCIHSNLMDKLKGMVCAHLDLLKENFDLYFPCDFEESLESDMWIINPFNLDLVNKSNLGSKLENLVDLSQDFSLRSKFQSCSSYGNFWTSLLHEKGAKEIATIALQKLSMMPTTYLAEKGFSVLTDIKMKKWNRLKSVDDFMRGALEETIHPRILKIASSIQAQGSHYR